MTIKSPSGAKKASQKSQTRKSPKCQNQFSFFMWASSKLRDSHFSTKQQHFTMSNVRPITFWWLQSLTHKLLEKTHSRTMASFTALFSSFVWMNMKHLVCLPITVIWNWLSLKECVPQNVLSRLDVTGLTLGPSISHGLANEMTLMYISKFNPTRCCVPRVYVYLTQNHACVIAGLCAQQLSFCALVFPPCQSARWYQYLSGTCAGKYVAYWTCVFCTCRQLSYTCQW